MSDVDATPSASSSQQSDGSKKSIGRVIRLVMLLLILAVALGGFYLDRQARNRLHVAYEKVQALLPAEETDSRDDPPPTTLAKIHEMLGEPHRKEDQPGHRRVDYYSYPGPFRIHELEVRYRGSSMMLHMEGVQKNSRWRLSRE